MMAQLGKTIEDVAITTFGLAVLPLVALVSPRTVVNSFIDGNACSLDAEDNQDLLVRKRVAPVGDKSELEALRNEVTELVDANKWTELAERIAEWDQTRQKTVQDRRYATLALDIIRSHLADAVYPPNMCNFEPYYAIPDGALTRVERAAEADPENPMLTALLAQVHIDRGWFARGGGWSDEVDEAGWEKLARSFEDAARLLQRHDLGDIRSPLYAYVQFQLLAAVDATVEVARDLYRLWSDLDITDLAPHRFFAFLMTPRWFGTWSDFEAQARSAADRTASATGDVAYAIFHLEALNHYDRPLTLMDIDRFEQGLNDFCAARGLPAQDALVLARGLQAEICTDMVPIWNELFHYRLLKRRGELRGVIKRLLARHVTCVPTEGKEALEKQVLNEISSHFQKELKAGKVMNITEDGIEFELPPEN